MASPKTRKPPPKPRKAAPRRATRGAKAPTLTLAEVGREAAKEAQRAALLAELRERNWNLTATGEALGIPNVSNLIRTIRSLGLETEYEAAKASGKIPMGPRGGE